MNRIPLRRLYQEFSTYYLKERCPGSPTNPRRLFNLCLKSVYPTYLDRLSFCECLAVAYATLGFPGSEPPGLFQTFDPELYTGKLSREDHFVNLFATKLRGNLGKVLRRTTDKGRRPDPAKYHARPELGLRRQTTLSQRDRDFIESVGEAVARLPQPERDIVRLRYWDDLPDCLIADLLAIDRKTVKARHAEALRRLRQHYGVAA